MNPDVVKLIMSIRDLDREAKKEMIIRIIPLCTQLGIDCMEFNELCWFSGGDGLGLELK